MRNETYEFKTATNADGSIDYALAVCYCRTNGIPDMVRMEEWNNRGVEFAAGLAKRGFRRSVETYMIGDRTITTETYAK